MFDKTKFLVVGDALLGVDRANNRLNAAKAQLETAKGIVEAARADIETAKEGVTTAKANLDTILAGFDNSGLSKATILSTAEDLNRVFSAVEPVAEQEVVAEPELSKASARKVIDSLRDVLSTVSDREDYADLRSPLEEILATVQSVGGSSKDESETKPKRKRRSKGDEDDTSAAEATTVVSTEAVEPAAVTDMAAVETETAAVVVGAEEQQTVEVVAEAVADVVNEVNNDEVKDEIIELIDSNVPAGDLNNLIATTAFAVYLGSQDRPLSLGDFLDAMTLETVKSASGADYLDDEMRGLVANMLEDSAYVSSALTWFVAGVRALENGKDFPAFEGVVQADVIEEAAVVEEVADVPTEVEEEQPVEEVDLTSADDQTIVGPVDAASDEVVAEDELLVLEEAEEVLEFVEEVAEEIQPEAAPVVVEPAPAPSPVEKPATAPARPAPSAPAEGLKKPNFFQRPSFPTKG
ncbi:hypothetical protein [Rhizobium sp. MHM7A]|uniref:hypothetical protein n=1 Tax=Rhizobium sp. MHM7A TaxID=2583233 RepID=UPI0011072C36|nr:hypothetical protein [Rhizobium sp. MHM7A]TLX17000.1 hypothetical protein FFR93_06680 [Rhizobium sp. MHM7A]